MTKAVATGSDYTMKAVLAQLFEYRRLDRATAKNILVDIAEHRVNEASMAAFMTVYLMRSIDVEELQGFCDALMDLCTPVELDGRNVVDIVGTGGDGKNTFNISTLAALVTASAGYPVVKHGNYGVSSACGSSNVLQELGYVFPKNSDEVLTDLERYGFSFLHAPLFHPAMKTVAPIRRMLGVKTFFNLLGPLVNPARPNHQVLGVYDPGIARLYEQYLQKQGGRYQVIHSLDGYDEVSLTGAVEIRNNEGVYLYEARDWGMKKVNPGQIDGGQTVGEASRIFLSILEGNGSTAQENVVLVNAALAIQAMAPNKTMEDAIGEARAALRSGRTFQLLKKMIA